MEAEPLPFYYATLSTSQRLPALDRTWRSNLEATGSLPTRPAAILADGGDDDVDEMEQMDEHFPGILATADASIGFIAP
jgi:hypothetical protein